MIEIDGAEALRLRERAQLIGGSSLTPTAVVARAGAMQGQDAAAVLRAIALRSAPGTTTADVRAAFDAGTLMRGWPMRGTLFAATPADLAGFAAVTAPRMQTTLRSRRETMGFSDELFATVRAVTVAALAQRPHTRAELARLWHDAGAPEGPGHDYHFTSTLAIDGVLALGPFDGKDQLVVSLPPSDEEPPAFLARIARAFFAARGPATLEDFSWWTKLPKSLLAATVDAVEGLEELTVDGRPMLHLDDESDAPPAPAVVLLPAFDEWLLGYRDRSLTGGARVLAQAATSNGLFRPIVLVERRIVGTWHPARGADLVEHVNAKATRAIHAAVAAWPYG